MRVMRSRSGCAGVLVAALLTSNSPTVAASDPGFDIPIAQSLNRKGARRYAVWIRVGDRFVEAMLDTGSTGLRVLPTVVPGDLTGTAADPVFEHALHMGGIVVTRPVEIGGLRGDVPIEVIDRIDCVATHPDCNAAYVSSDTYLIGGDGIPSQGYSAILGIGFSAPTRDLPNPLEALGAKRWIVELPRPDDNDPGHLRISPDDLTADGFTPMAKTKVGDFQGCVRGPNADILPCGGILMDTGAPHMSIDLPDAKTTTVWPKGSPGKLVAQAKDTKLTMLFETGADDGPANVFVVPTAPGVEATTINAGIFLFFRYAALYEASEHLMGLKRRDPIPTRDQANLAPKPTVETAATRPVAPAHSGPRTRPSPPR